MQVNAIERLLSAVEVAEMLGVSRRTFETILQRNEGPPFILIGRQRRWRPQDVANWINILATRAAQQRREKSAIENHDH
jgi:excisionase family DNA binding protein